MISAVAAAESAGTGLGAGTFRLRAQQVGAFGLPEDVDAWDRAALLARMLHRRGDAAGPAADRWAEFGVASCQAYGVDDPALVSWWLERLPRR